MKADDLLTGSDRWRIASLAVECASSLTLSVVPNAVSAQYPVCGSPRCQRHSWDRHTALDLPWRKSTVRLRVWARRFFCDQVTCPRKIFVERFTGLLPRYGRRTEDATNLLLANGESAGGGCLTVALIGPDVGAVTRASPVRASSRCPCPRCC